MATYSAIGKEPERWRKAVTVGAPFLAALETAFQDYDKMQRSFFIYMLQPALHQAKYAEYQEAGDHLPDDVPLLHLHGTEDGILPARLTEGAGHFVHVEVPTELNRRVLEWLGQP